MDTIEISPSKTHILAFPFPAKGHMNPMLHLCNHLASKGFRVTLITTISTYKDFKTKGGLIDLELIPDERENISSKQVSAHDPFKMLRDSVTETMPGIIEKYKLLGPDFSPKVLIYDSTMPWMLEVAQGHGVLGASFFTQPCYVSAVYYHMLQGTVAVVPPLGDESSRVFLLPCLPPLEINDLPGFEYFKEYSGFVSKILLDQFLNIDKVDYILFNTFDKLEAEVAKWMASKWKILTVGPVAPTTAATTTTSTVLLEEEEEEEKKKNKKYLFETNTEVCMKWLDEREPNSVIYVSFGSAATSTEEQMEEIAEGLLMSNFNFLWVVRDEERSKLPNDHPIMNNNSSVNTTTSTGKSGLIINWCPQLDVLSHGSVACFMTHCGWNSTVEAISSGVPMIAVPQWADQTTNAKFIQDVWKIGVRVTVDGDGCGDCKDNNNINGLVRREEIVRCVREVCESESEKGKELKRNAMKWKDLAKEAVSEGGSSDRNLEEFASSLLFY